MARVVIVGAGVTGREVAKRLDDPVVIESDVEKATMLKRELGDVRVVVGDATDERTLLQAGVPEARSLLVCLGNDRDAYQTVLNSKPYKNLRNVIAVLQKPDEVPRFQRLGVQSIIIPDLATASEVLAILKPSEKRISEIVITKGASAIGQRLDDLRLPWGTSVIGVMRGDKLMAPMGDMVLETMDVVHVSADVEELNEVRGVFLGDHRQLLPFSKIVVPVMDESWFETEFQEALSMAMFCQSGIIGMFPAEAPWLVKKSGESCLSMQVPFFSLPGYDLDFQSIDDALRAAAQVDIDALREAGEEDIVEVMKKEREGKNHLHAHGEEEDPDLLVLRSDTLRLMERVGKKPLCVQAAEETVTPILVARHVDPYASILFMLDGSPRSNNIASLALRVAIAFGSKVTALTAHDPEHEEADLMLKHIKRTGEMYGLEIVEDEVEGNPTLEFVSLVKSGDHDLTLVNRACKTVKRDIIRRVYMSAPKSVMII
jgi:Trk K+ transport system NAD-binding subunit/nucleotide-binding universal stress UspA family protein